MYMVAILCILITVSAVDIEFYNRWKNRSLPQGACNWRRRRRRRWQKGRRRRGRKWNFLLGFALVDAEGQGQAVVPKALQEKVDTKVWRKHPAGSECCKCAIKHICGYLRTSWAGSWPCASHEHWTSTGGGRGQNGGGNGAFFVEGGWNGANPAQEEVRISGAGLWSILTLILARLALRQASWICTS